MCVFVSQINVMEFSQNTSFNSVPERGSILYFDAAYCRPLVASFKSRLRLPHLPAFPPPCPPLQADVGTSEVDRRGRRCRPVSSVFLAGNFFRALEILTTAAPICLEPKMRKLQEREQLKCFEVSTIFIKVKWENGDITG